jgi:hypothetical protein
MSGDTSAESQERPGLYLAAWRSTRRLARSSASPNYIYGYGGGYGTGYGYGPGYAKMDMDMDMATCRIEKRPTAMEALTDTIVVTDTDMVVITTGVNDD